MRRNFFFRHEKIFLCYMIDIDFNHFENRNNYKTKFFYLLKTYLVIFFHYYMDYELNTNFKSFKIDYVPIKTYILNMDQAFF